MNECVRKHVPWCINACMCVGLSRVWLSSVCLTFYPLLGSLIQLCLKEHIPSSSCHFITLFLESSSLCRYTSFFSILIVIYIKKSLSLLLLRTPILPPFYSVFTIFAFLSSLQLRLPSLLLLLGSLHSVSWWWNNSKEETNMDKNYWERWDRSRNAEVDKWRIKWERDGGGVCRGEHWQLEKKDKCLTEMKKKTLICVGVTKT